MLNKAERKLLSPTIGRPFYKVVPLNSKYDPKDVFKDLIGKVEYYEDINNPTFEEWSDKRSYGFYDVGSMYAHRDFL